jgi:hypothetical protein
MSHQGFLSDECARIPFSVIGIFLLLGSSVTTVYILRLEQERSSELARSLDFNDIEQLLRSAEADCATALNTAGMKALQAVGKNPVIVSPLGSAALVNQFRVKETICDELCVYLMGHYLEDVFSNGRYAINIVLVNETPIPSVDAITLDAVPMTLDRLSIPLIGPGPQVNHSTYWVASVPLTFAIRTLNGGTWEQVATRTVVVSSILTSRYPLLECLMGEYEQVINGTFSPLWTFTTVFANLYSVLRGLRHYAQGEPANVVDNHHLAVILNSGLLLEQSLVFSSVDPLGVVELARRTLQVLRQTPKDRLATLNEDMTGAGFTIDTDAMTSGSANVDAGCPLNASFDDSFMLNFSEVAERILYNITSVTLRFEDADGDVHWEDIVFDKDAPENIQAAVRQQANCSFFLTDVLRQLTVNSSTEQHVQQIISEMYQVSMATQVVNRTAVLELTGDPGVGWTSGGAGPWEATLSIPLSTQLITPEKGAVRPGCALYQETYNVSYERTHLWWRMEYDQNGTLVRVWNNMTDHQVETVGLQVVLQHYAGYGGSQDDVVDVLYYNQTVDDPNLDDALMVYLSTYPDADPEKQQLIITQGNQGAFGCESVCPGSMAPWAAVEAWDALDAILRDIGGIGSDPNINATNYPNPLLLLQQEAASFVAECEQRLPQYVNYSLYHPGDGFCSVGKKAVYVTCDWFMRTVMNASEAVADFLSMQLMATLEDAIPQDLGVHANNISETIDDAVDAVRNQCTIPFGCEMTLTSRDTDGFGEWNESVRLAVDQSPEYLDPFEKTGDEELWTMKLRNRCLLGPTGLPILPPTPVTPWVATVNVWVIDVEGEYAHLKIIDSSDETIFNPLLGHEPQEYVREEAVVTAGNVTLGENTRVSFGFTTVAVGVVPSWGMMLGDLQENWFDEQTPGFEDSG